MLADNRRIVMDAGRVFGQMNPGSEQCRRPRGRVIALNERAALLDMPIFHHLADGQHRRAEIIQLAQPVPNFLASFPACPGSDELLQFAAVLAARGDGRKPRILKKIVSVR